MTDADRYRLLRDHVISKGIIRFHVIPLEESDPMVSEDGREFAGPTFEAAVDSLEGVEGGPDADLNR